MEAEIVQLTPEQANVLNNKQEVRMVDPTTQRVYVVLLDETFSQLKQTLDQLESIVKERGELFDERKEQDWWLDVARRGRELLEKENSTDT
jgi:hypothetical protein